MRPLTRVAVFGIPVLAGVLVYPLACPRGPLSVPDATYRETVTAFYTGLAAMQTSQEVLARKEFERVTQLVPEEPAGWANLGLLLMRQQEMEPAATHLRKAGDLAGGNAAIERLLALLESRNGRLPEAIRALEERDGGRSGRPEGAVRPGARPRARGRRRVLAEAQQALGVAARADRQPGGPPGARAHRGPRGDAAALQ